MILKPETKNLFSEAVVKHIDDAMIAANKAQPKRNYLGASLWGKECNRQLAYIFHGVPEDDGTGFEGKTLRIFDMGHDGEARVAKYVKLAGFDLITEKADGKQFGFYEMDGRLRGHIDGAIVSGPALEGMNYPVLWENKALNASNWKKAGDDGIKKANFVYYVQAQVYMAYMELFNGCMFTTLNRNTGELNAEFIPFDPVFAQGQIDRIVSIVKTAAPEEMARVSTTDETDFRCRFCNYSKRCWEKPQQQTNNQPLPTWLKGPTN
jgi:hypothetical protein